MTTVPAMFKAPQWPQVNLMPPEVEQRRQRGRQRNVVIVLLVIFALLVAAVYVFAVFQARAAQDHVAELEAETGTLSAQLAAYSEVDIVRARLENADSARQVAAGLEVFYPLMASSVVGALPPGTVIETTTFSLPTPNSSPSAPTSPFGVAQVGTITMGVIVPQYVDTSLVQDRLDAVPFFDRTRVVAVGQHEEDAGPESGGAEAVVTGYRLDITVSLTYNALMLRFTDAWFGIEAAEDGTVSTNEDNLRAYYEEFYQSLLAGTAPPTEFPPVPDVTPPPFVPGQGGLAPEAPPTDPAVSPSPVAGEE